MFPGRLAVVLPPRLRHTGTGTASDLHRVPLPACGAFRCILLGLRAPHFFQSLTLHKHFIYQKARGKNPFRAEIDCHLHRFLM